MLIKKYGIYSLFLLIFGCLIYLNVDPITPKFFITELLNINTYSTSYNSKKFSNKFLLNRFNNVNSIPGTTGPGIPNIIQLTLSTKYGPINESATSFYGAGSGMYLFIEKNSAISYLFLFSG